MPKPEHPFNLVPISQEQIDNTALVKRLMVDVGPATDGALPTHSLAITPTQLVELGISEEQLNATHTGDAIGATALTVVGINGVVLSGLSTGLLKNTTGTGVPSIAIAGTDYLTPSGSGSSLTGITSSQISGLGTLATQNGTFSGSSSGTNTGDQDLSGYVTTGDTGTVTNTMLAGSIDLASKVTGTLSPSCLPTSGVTAGSYTNANVTVDNLGRITSASNGSFGINVGTTSITNGANGSLLISGSVVSELALGSGISTWLATPTLANFNTALSDANIATTEANTFTGAQTIIPSSAATPLTLTGGTVATALPVLDMTQTWNAAGVKFTALKLNVSNTAHAATSVLFDFQYTDTSRVNYNVDDGYLKIKNNDTYSEWGGLGGGIMQWRLYGVTNMTLAAGAALNLSTTSSFFSINADTIWRRASAASWQAGTNHATTATNQTIKAHDVTTGTGASLTLQGGNGSVARGNVVLHGGNRAAYDAAPSTTTVRDILISHGLMAAS
jgi:hypothetical protein